MSSLTITKPSSGDTDWGVTLNTALDEIVEHVNTHNHGRIKENGYLTTEPDSNVPAFGRVLVTDAFSSSGKAWINSVVKGSAFNKNFGEGENDVARGNHTHEIANITELETQLSDKADLDHKHVLSDITDIQTLLGSVGAANVHLSGASANSHHLLLTASHVGTASVVEYNFIYSSDSGMSASIKSASPSLIIPKNFDAPTITFRYKVVITNIFDRRETAETADNTATVYKHTGGITVSEIVNAIIAEQAFIKTITDGVAHKTVVELWAKQQPKGTEEPEETEGTEGTEE